MGVCLYLGFGFVDFESPVDAQAAVVALQSEGVYAQFAKLPQVRELLHTVGLSRLRRLLPGSSAHLETAR